uniref:Uncharacterized protein n=1 Tax=Fusarium oxysporum (strain Fo5176) TaxID=660025 RepID=A0A0D2Y8C4_FUSOF
MTAWQKLNEYYTKLGDSPLFAASIILHPSLGMNYLEVNWASEEQLVWVRDAKIGKAEAYVEWNGIDMDPHYGSICGFRGIDLDPVDILKRTKDDN